jgi:hypothetical protein
MRRGEPSSTSGRHHRQPPRPRFGRTPRPYLNSDLVEAIGATYVRTREMTLSLAAAAHWQFDLIFEATGFWPLAFEVMCVLLAKNGVIVLSSATRGMRRVEVPADAINLDFVLGNKVMVGRVNANRAHFDAGVGDLAILEASYPGSLGRLLTHRVDGLDQ